MFAASIAAALVLSLGGNTALAVTPSVDEDLAAQMLAKALTSATAQTPQSDKVAPQADTTNIGGWALDTAVAKGGEIFEAGTGDYAGYTHLKAGGNNGNSTTGATPATAIHDATYDFSKEGSVRFLVKSPQAGRLNRFGFYLGYASPASGLYMGYNASGWFWQRYGGDGQYKTMNTTLPAADEELDILISWDGATAKLTANGEEKLSVDYSAMPDVLTDKLGMTAGKFNEEYTDIYIKDWQAPVTYAVSGTVTTTDGTAIQGATVRLGDASATTDANGAYTFAEVANGKHTLSVSAKGYEDASKEITVADGDLSVDAITLTKEVAIVKDTLATKQMTVEINKTFPSVLQYTMADGKIMHGQSKNVRLVNINGHDIKLGEDDVTYKKDGDTKAIYTLKIKDAANDIDATLTVEMEAKANTLRFDVTKIVNNLSPNAKKSADGVRVENDEHPIQTIAFPNHSLVSVRAGQDDAQFTGARMSSDTNKNGDTNFAVTAGTNDNSDYTYGFVSGAGLSAGLWSNSEHDGTTASSTVAGGAKNTRVLTTTQSVDGDTSLGLSSAAWYYHRTVTDSKKQSYTVAETAMPAMAVAIAADENGDGTVNWQDGALAYRSIMNNPLKSEEVPELVAWRIAMNFGGQAQNPFLTTLDNVKKVALNTDGLGQSVLLKGYGSEGHDSGHPDYANIGERIGGAEDMNTLMEEGAKYGARFGIHVNASEMYPEAHAFSEDSVRRNAAGGLSYGWNWLDQGVGIDGIWDLSTGSRETRFDELKEKVGDNMDFIYLDVWGNLTSSGSEDSWETRKMSKMINDNGWRMTTEWGAGNEYDSTFQHWAADLTYGGAGMKGENSQVMRFLRNHQKDSWVGDYPSYGGAANAPLLGGYNMKDFEGWQGRNDYDAYITNLFTHDVSTKFIQHFKVSRWVNSPLDATSTQDPNTNNGNEFIELKDDHGNVVTLARGSNDSSSAAYRDRVITLNGKTIATGAVSKGDGKGKGTESYLLPWLWDAETGELVKGDDQKLYHWNTQGGTTQWTLPAGWENLQTVKVYKLTDQGKTDEKIVSVADGKVTLSDMEAETPYVIYKGDAKPKQLTVTWSDACTSWTPASTAAKPPSRRIGPSKARARHPSPRASTPTRCSSSPARCPPRRSSPTSRPASVMRSISAWTTAPTETPR